MVRITFTHNIQRHIACPTETLEAKTVRQALDAVFSCNERARGYVLDDRGALRRHMIVFVNGQAIQDREAQSDSVPDGSEIYVMQALSGG